MAGTQTRIGLWRPQLGIASGRGGLHVHYAMHINDQDFDPAVARLREHGYDPEIVSFDDDDRGRSLYVTDPDGNVVECWTWEVEATSLVRRPMTLADATAEVGVRQPRC